MSQVIEDIMEIARGCSQFRADGLAACGRKGCHASYLREICENPGISQDKLAQRIYINKSNVARQVAVLAEGGFVTRCGCSSDKRVTELYPTQKTLDLLPRILEIMENCEQLLAGDLSGEEYETLCHVLARMKAKAATVLEDNDR